MQSLDKVLRVIISEEISNLPENDLDIIFNYLPDLWQFPDRLSKQIQDADGLIVRNQTRVDKALLTNVPNLRVIGRLGTGLDNIDLQAARASGIQVVYAPGAGAISVAEYCLTQIYNILRKLPAAIHSTRSGEWLRTQFMGRELSDIVVGLVGYGNTAQALSERLYHLGGNVIVATRSPEKVPGSFKTVSLSELLKDADIVSLHVPGGAESYHLVGDPELREMKSSSWLLNTSRGSVIDEKALTAALVSGEIAGAVLDVREDEPPAAGLLESLPNFIATPHIAAFTFGAQKRVEQTIIAQVSAVLKGSIPPEFGDGN